MPFPLFQRETPKGRFSASSKGLGNLFYFWCFSTSSCAPWMSWAVPSSWLEVWMEEVKGLGWGWCFRWIYFRKSQLSKPHAVAVYPSVLEMEVTWDHLKSCPHFTEEKTNALERVMIGWLKWLRPGQSQCQGQAISSLCLSVIPGQEAVWPKGLHEGFWLSWCLPTWGDYWLRLLLG